MNLTKEQEMVLATDIDLVINAVAGSGKTTTLIEYARSRGRQSRILYMAFNKTVKSEAFEKFSASKLPNVKVETTHSLAYEHIIRQSAYKVTAGYRTDELCRLLKIRTGDRHTDLGIAGHVNKFIGFFCNSAATRVQDLNYAESLSDGKAKSFVINFYGQIERLTREALAKMEKGEIDVIHDFYLKKFQLITPVLPYDYILFDEGQDASPAMLDVFLKQSAKKIIVGDMHQQIYGWRYAVNSLQKVDYPVFNLSQSFRFDDEIALVANKILAWKQHLGLPEAVKITGVGRPDGTIKTKATIGRSNLSLLMNAISQWQYNSMKKIFFEGNISRYTFADEGASLYDVLNLFNGKRERIKDSMIAEMTSMKDLEEYIDKTDDNSLRMIVDVVKEFGNRLPTLITNLKLHHTDRKEEAEMIFSTVHKSKGMEYDQVTLLSDFTTEQKIKKFSALEKDRLNQAEINRFAEEVNILYVAATRTKTRLEMPEEISPLRSIGLASRMPSGVPFSYTKRSFDDGNLYNHLKHEIEFERRIHKSTNHGKKWTEDEQTLLTEMYSKGRSTREIAIELARGEKGVRLKLINLGLLSED